MSGVDAAVRRVVRAYRDDRRAQLHVCARLVTSPLTSVVDRLPRHGTIVDLGCGHGAPTLLAAVQEPGRRLVGLDIDARKIPAARRAAERLELGDRVRFDLAPAHTLVADLGAIGPVTAVVCIDVLYLLGTAAALRVLESAASAIPRGAMVLVKEMADRPRWKARWNQLQEVAATGVFGYTRGDHVEVLPPALIEDTLTRAGLAVTTIDLSARYPAPHLLIIGVR